MRRSTPMAPSAGRRPGAIDSRSIGVSLRPIIPRRVARQPSPLPLRQPLALSSSIPPRNPTSRSTRRIESAPGPRCHPRVYPRRSGETALDRGYPYKGEGGRRTGSRHRPPHPPVPLGARVRAPVGWRISDAPGAPPSPPFRGERGSCIGVTGLNLYHGRAIVSNMESALMIIIGRSANGSRWSHQVSLLSPSAPPIGSLPGGLRLGANRLVYWALRLVSAVKSSFLPVLREAAEGAAVVPFLAGRARGCVLEGTNNRLEGRLGLEIGVERQRPRGGIVGPPFRLVGLVPDDPAVPVRQAPGHDHLYRGLVESRVEEPAIGVGDQAVSNRHVGGCILVGDVELGDLDRQAETRDFGEKPPQQRCRKGRSADRRQMGLDADRVDRRAGSSHSFEQMQQRDAAGFLLGRVELDIVFVYDEAGARIGVPCCMVGEIEILGDESLEKHRGAQTI